MQCNVSSIFVHFGYPFGVSFGPKMVQNRCPKPSAKMKVSSSVLGGVTPLQGDSEQTAGRQQGDSRETARRQQGDHCQILRPDKLKAKAFSWAQMSYVLCQMQSANAKCKVQCVLCCVLGQMPVFYVFGQVLCMGSHTLGQARRIYIYIYIYNCMYSCMYQTVVLEETAPHVVQLTC